MGFVSLLALDALNENFSFSLLSLFPKRLHGFRFAAKS
jgi:hypothetical protein